MVSDPRLLQRMLREELSRRINREKTIDELTAALRQWLCPTCKGARSTYEDGSYECSYCNGTGLHPIARKALGCNHDFELSPIPLTDGFYWIEGAGAPTIAERRTYSADVIQWCTIGSEDYYIGDGKVVVIAKLLYPPRRSPEGASDG